MSIIQWPQLSYKAVLCTTVPHVEIHNIFRISPLYWDGKGFKRMESECNQAPDCVVDRPTQKSCLDFKLQKARVSGIESARKKEKETDKEAWKTVLTVQNQTLQF